MSYGKVHDVFWDNEDIETLSDRAALLALFLITGPHRNAIGCFKLGKGAITDVPRFAEWGTEGVSDALSELVGMGFCYRDERTGWTFIRKHLDHDPVKGGKSAIHAAALADRPPTNTEVYRQLYQQLNPALEGCSEALSEKPGWPMRSPTEAPPEGVSKGHVMGNRSPSPLPLPEPLPSPSDRDGASKGDVGEPSDEPSEPDPPDEQPDPTTVKAAPKPDTGGIPKILDRRDPPGKAGELAARVRAIYLDVYQIPSWHPNGRHNDAGWLEGWAKQGFLPDDLERVFRKILDDKPDGRPACLSYFEQPMARYAAENEWDLAYNLRPPLTDEQRAERQAEIERKEAEHEESGRRDRERLNRQAAALKAKRDAEMDKAMAGE